MLNELKWANYVRIVLVYYTSLNRVNILNGLESC